MDSTTRTSLAVGAAAGYIVGRTKRERFAVGLLSLAAGRVLNPGGPVDRGIRKIAGNSRVEHFSESLADALQQRTRSLLEGGEEPGGKEPDAPEAGASEPGVEEAGPVRPSRTPRAGPAKAPKSSAHAAGPKNPPAARAEAMGRKAKANRAARKPGPQNPPAARAEAMGRKGAAGKAAGKGPAARGKKSR